ncbi:aminodeoxychorismate/anthranilate synthase component II [Methanoculleus sp.]|uniref:anthranilate synthase component II n=1 Tax=Methanoculleus sp. TaxID=90427 RepID=UPI0026011600|nr:aminodeoxychorismate/anthranilate synthase component II [Methanoculleus sp.]
MRVLVIDSYDSFTFNLCQQIGMLGAEPVVVKSDTPFERLRFESFDRVVLSPGPGHPRDSALYRAVLTSISRTVPTLGVCLGHQAIGLTFGASIARADRLMHGKRSLVRHDGAGIYAGVPDPLVATRYHSLVIDPATIPDCLEVTARSDDDGAVMGVRHREFPIEGVQFHPESILTPDGNRLIANFLSGTGGGA